MMSSKVEPTTKPSPKSSNITTYLSEKVGRFSGRIAKKNKQDSILSQPKKEQKKMGNDFITKTFNQSNQSPSSKRLEQRMRSISSPELPTMSKKRSDSIDYKSPSLLRRKRSDVTEFFKNSYKHEKEEDSAPISAQGSPLLSWMPGKHKKNDSVSPTSLSRKGFLKKSEQFAEDKEPTSGQSSPFTAWISRKSKKKDIELTIERSPSDACPISCKVQSADPLTRVLEEIMETEHDYNQQLDLLVQAEKTYREEEKFFDFLDEELRKDAHEVLAALFKQAIELKNYSDLFILTTTEIWTLEGRNNLFLKTLKGSRFAAYQKTAIVYENYLEFKKDLSEKKSSIFDQALNQLVRNEQKLEFEALTIAMIQRLPRFFLFIQKLLEHVDKESEEYKICETASNNIDEAIQAMSKKVSENVRHTLMPLHMFQGVFK